MNAADVLEKAADVIVERGWTQGVYEDAGGCVCVGGAIVTAIHGKPPNEDDGLPGTSPAYPPMMTFLSWVQLRGPRLHSLADWNDAKGRTADEVITALRECAASLRAAS